MKFEPYQGDQSYIFISYAHKDKQFVWPVLDRMISHGFRIWYDEGIDPGTEWDTEIAQHIEQCGYFISLISKNYIESENCRDELSYARDLGKNRLLVYLEQTELDAGMSMRLNRLQAIFKYTYNNQEDFYKKLFQAQGISLFREMSKNIVDEEESLPVSDYSPEVVQLRRNLDFGDQKAYKQTCKHVIEKIVETINMSTSIFTFKTKKSLSDSELSIIEKNLSIFNVKKESIIAAYLPEKLKLTDGLILTADAVYVYRNNKFEIHFLLLPLELIYALKTDPLHEKLTIILMDKKEIKVTNEFYLTILSKFLEEFVRISPYIIALNNKIKRDKFQKESEFHEKKQKVIHRAIDRINKQLGKCQFVYKQDPNYLAFIDLPALKGVNRIFLTDEIMYSDILRNEIPLLRIRNIEIDDNSAWITITLDNNYQMRVTFGKENTQIMYNFFVQYLEAIKDIQLNV